MVEEEEGKKRWEERRSRRRCSNGFLGMVLEREREREREGGKFGWCESEEEGSEVSVKVEMGSLNQIMEHLTPTSSCSGFHLLP